MHAYLLIGQEISNFQFPISNLAQKLKAKILNFPIVKIEDARNLNNLIRLSFDEPTLIVIENINEAGDEALNALLKNLEEPQENIYFALTSPSIRKVLPTIVSRCEIVRVQSTEYKVQSDDAEKFLAMKPGEKLNHVDKIKDREKAIEFAENTVNFLHSQLHLKDVKYGIQAKNIEAAEKTLSGLKANGNVNLLLTNLVINL
ncbi:MAG TPA: hypothetical protein VKC54_01340 [Patescibacteria group bacterium]|nr:hypothetical protein [Patescibacteria group bacterium]